MHGIGLLPSSRASCAGFFSLPKATGSLVDRLIGGAESSRFTKGLDLQPGIRPYSILSKPFRRKSQPDTLRSCRSWARTTVPNGAALHATPAPAGLWQYLRQKVREEDEDDGVDGPRFRAKDLTQEEITRIFGEGVPEEIGNRILRFQHARRLEGSLTDDSDTPMTDVTKRLAARALTWLRRNYPVDERAAYEARVRKQERLHQDALVADAERIGIYHPQMGVKNGDVYGRSAFEDFRDEVRRIARIEAKKAEKAKREAAAKARKQAEEVRKNTGKIDQVGPAAELRLAEPPKWVQYYRKRAVLSDFKTVPEMSKTARLLPSAITAVLVLSGCYLFAELYTFPTTPSGRLWPDIPPAAATITGLMFANLAVLVAWRIPPLWRTLNTYFIHVPGSPVALSLVGNFFSHQGPAHFATNMVVLWWIGTNLHDQIGRGNFLAIYIASGTVGTMISLTRAVLTKNLISSTLGASSAIAGLTSAWCAINLKENFSILYIPPDILPPVSGLTLLITLVAVECTAVLLPLRSVDTWAHLGGYLAGVVGAGYVLRRRQHGGPWLRPWLQARAGVGNGVGPSASGDVLQQGRESDWMRRLLGR